MLFYAKITVRQNMNLLLMNLSPFIIAGGGALAIIIFVILFFVFRKRKEPEEIEEKIDDDQWLKALGEVDNIKSVSVRGSRLSLELLDDKKIDRDALTSLGVKSIITMSNKLILVIEKNAEEVANIISSHLS